MIILETAQETLESSRVVEKSPRGKKEKKTKQQKKKSNKLLKQLRLVIIVFVITALIAYDYQIVRERQVEEEWSQKLSKVERKNKMLLEQTKELELLRNEAQELKKQNQQLEKENQQLLKELEQFKDIISTAKQEFWNQLGENSVLVTYLGTSEISQNNINVTCFFLNDTKALVELITMRDIDIYHNNISIVYSSMLINESLRFEEWVQTKKNPNPSELQTLWKNYVLVDNFYTQMTDVYNFNQTTKDYALSLINPEDTMENVIYKILLNVDSKEDRNCYRRSKQAIILLRSLGIESRMKAGKIGPSLVGSSRMTKSSHAWIEVHIGNCWLEYNANGLLLETSLIESIIEHTEFKYPPAFPDRKELSHKRQINPISPTTITRYENNIFKIEYVLVPQNP